MTFIVRTAPMALLGGIVVISTALAALPCKTDEEALAEATVGYFLVQQIASQRCDEELGDEVFKALHGKVVGAYQSKIDSARDIRIAFFKRAYGDTWEAEHRKVTEITTDLLLSTLVATPETCGQLKGALEARLNGGWARIEARLQRRADAVHRDDKFVCDA